ncbi:MAG: HlyD family efflux transporter periplasmic adaptor subunit, partial [Lachnospiraceae bacterium]|nr:HlyD family efflux transporter periplasmic adaptor subunit [Lachnospiraceae bacterium]
MILIYLVVYFCVYFFGSRTSIYEVTEGAVASVFDGQYTGLALREETIVTSPGTGYVNFFVGDATPISVGEQTYILDGSGKIASKLEEAAKNQAILSEDNLNQIKDTIHDFDTSFDSQNYYDVYSFKYRIESQMLDLINGSVFENINNELSEMGENTYQIVSSDISGVVMHNIDGYEGKTTDQIESSDFKKSNYQKQIIKTNDLVAEGDPVYKVITSETWKLVIQIDDASVFDEKSYVNIEFLKDNITASADIETFTKAGNTYAVLTCD